LEEGGVRTGDTFAVDRNRRARHRWLDGPAFYLLRAIKTEGSLRCSLYRSESALAISRLYWVQPRFAVGRGNLNNPVNRESRFAPA